MHGATLDELRELSRRSRSAQGAAFAGLGATLVGSAFGAFWAVLSGGLALVGFAYVMGQERGAFRRVFKRIAEDKRSRRLEIQEPGAPTTVSQNGA
ncbi:MAG TPA: hypothetical protein VM370_04145 [Candidatus Thermoplasmatota archaeon]|nr:hypothetical protein [Candidatus Thermoplasmatota archaeon]